LLQLLLLQLLLLQLLLLQLLLLELLLSQHLLQPLLAADGEQLLDGGATLWLLRSRRKVLLLLPLLLLSGKLLLLLSGKLLLATLLELLATRFDRGVALVLLLDRTLIVGWSRRAREHRAWHERGRSTPLAGAQLCELRGALLIAG
jgi:hypothetical protein